MEGEPLRPDDPRVIGEYTLVRRIGEGGQGVVYLAAHPDSGDGRFALKVLAGEVDASSFTEIALVQEVARFCTARVLDAGVADRRAYIVSEYVDGPSLLDVVEERGPLAGLELERLAVGTITALAATHAAGVVHRDFKPHNVLLAADGPRVVDFGVAVALGAGVARGAGTPRYMAPEQAGRAEVGTAADIWSWAVTMVFAALGPRAFETGVAPNAFNRRLAVERNLPDLPAWLGRVVGPCLQEVPARRPAADEVLLRLLGYDAERRAAEDETRHDQDEAPADPEPGDEPEFAPREPRTPTMEHGRSRREDAASPASSARIAVAFWRRRRGLMITTALALAASLAVGLGAWLWPSSQGRPSAAVTPPPHPAITVGSANFAESRLLSELYAQALEAKGLRVTRRQDIGSREVYYPLVVSGDVDVMPEYNGALASHLGALKMEASDPTSTRRVNERLRRRLPSGLEILASAPAEDKDAIVVTRGTAEASGLRTIADLRGTAGEYVLGGAPEFQTRHQGLIGLRARYRIAFKDFQPFRHEDFATMAALLSKGTLQAATLFTTDPAIGVNDLVVLEDSEHLFSAQNITPLINRADVDARAKAALNAISAKLTTEDLLYMNTRVAINRDRVQSVAKAWLVQTGLI
ncbi:glycine betaine ABC transporter substrate-binding protein [Spirillospora sp. NPDC047279]|uniref:glycine betaine ABC transporter substrate-binding protein n=1 Tax=Spirillospora sp. NPDC047279 TaxID=3155478 RepID=UPI0033E8D1B3